jgi:NAD(P)-dependent dehydrogenase (short-subunit alcohol dehydrogenase family)
MAKLKGKRILITGGANGIGRSMAEYFAKDGAMLILSDMDAAGLEKTAEELRAAGAQVHTYKIDISKKDQVDAMAADVIARFGGLDILINNAGIGHNGELVETPIPTWEKLMAVDFWGTLYHVYAFLPHMIRAKSGHIVTVSSGQAYFRMPTWGPYSVIKLALGAFSELLRIEMHKFGIKVTTVYPFMIRTGFYNKIDGESFGAKLSMKLLPFYSQKPDTVGKIIYKAVKKEKPVEMVHVINTLGFVTRAIPPVSNLVSHAALLFLGKSREHLMEDAHIE